MDSLCSLERWLEFDVDFDEPLNIDIIGKDSDEAEIFGEIADHEILFIVEGDNLFIFDKKYLNDIVEMLESYGFYEINIDVDYYSF